MVVVSDTSSISNLIQIGQIDLLYKLYGEITIPPTVKRELFTIENQEKIIAKLDWIKTISPKDQKLISELLQMLDLGESESIALALEHKAKYLIIDEYKGREIANQYGLKIVGVLGILIQAKLQELIPSVKLQVNKLQEIGFRLNPKLISEVLNKLGEE